MPQPIHERIEDWLAAALADDLSPEECRNLNAHLADCEHCRAISNDMTMTNEILQRELMPAVGPAAGFEARLLAGFRRRQSERPGTRLLSLMSWLMRLRGVQIAGAAALLLALVEVGSTVTGGGRERVAAGFDSTVHSGTDRVAALPQAQIESKFVEITQSNTKELNFDVGLGQSNFPHTTQFQSPQIPQDFGREHGHPALSGVDALRRTVARDIPALAAVAAPAFPVTPTTPPNFEKRSGDDKAESQSKQRGLTERYDVRLSGSNTYTGGVTIESDPAIAGELSKDKEIAKRSYDFAYGLNDSPADKKSPVMLGDVTRDTAGKTAHFFDDTNVQGQSSAPSTASDGPVPAQTPGPSGATTPSPLPAPESRKLIRNARAELEVPAFDAAVDAITVAASQDGGYIDTKNSARGANGKLSGTLVIKVSPDNLDRFLQRLRALGEVKNQTVRAEDITKAYYDTDARLRNSKRMEDRLLKMLEEVKGKMSEVLQVEKELGRVRSEIEQMQGELKLYDFQVSYATVSLNLYEKDLNQPAAFLLRETANLSLLADDVEKTYADARRIADAAKAQVLVSNVNRDTAGRFSAVLNLLIAPDQASALITQIKALARVQNYTLQDERVPQNGSSGNVSGAETAKVERAPVAFNINIAHDEQTRRQISLRVVAKDVEAAFDKARAAAVNAGGEMVSSNVAHPQEAHASAQLVIRVPARGYAGLLEVLKTFGRVSDFQTQRDASSAESKMGETEDSPTLITLNLADVEPAVQQTNVQVLTADVEKRLSEIKQTAVSEGAEVSNSTFSRESDGSERAGLEIRLPLSGYPTLIERVRALGEVKYFTVERKDRPASQQAGASGNDASAPAGISLTLYSQGQIVGESSGVAATVRRTFGQGVGALMWSVQMIGVALAFLAPWAVALGLVFWLARRIWRRRQTVRLEPKQPE